MQCKNCDIALNRKFKYCPECGQKTTFFFSTRFVSYIYHNHDACNINNILIDNILKDTWFLKITLKI